MTIGEPILKIGTFGTHIIDTPAGNFTFAGTVPVSCAGTFKSYDDALVSFIAFYKSQPVEWQREHIGDVRNDVFTAMMNA